MMKKGSIATVLFVLIVGIVGAVFLYGGGSSETGAMLLEQNAKPSKSPEPKVQMCHRTGSKIFPWVTISVASSAVAVHLAHEDTLGACPTNRECVCSYNCQCEAEFVGGGNSLDTYIKQLGGTKGAASGPNCCPAEEYCDDVCKADPDPTDPTTLDFADEESVCVGEITCETTSFGGGCSGKGC